MASLDKYKLTQNTWDSDANPEKLLHFVTNMGAMVRAIVHGGTLEDYLNVKLGRNTLSHVTTPSFLVDDDDFKPPDVVNAVIDEEPSVSNLSSDTDDVNSSTDPSANSSQTMGSQTLYPAGSYYSLSIEARELDALLYNVLRMCVKGAKSVLLECVQFPSYVQGIIVLTRHHDISRNDRITQAYAGMDDLSYNGDVCAWQAQAVKAVRELFDSGATVMHYVLTRILKSFNGKLTTIQYRIAEDINQRIIDKNTNIYDMLQKYSVEIASVGSSKTSVNMAREEYPKTPGIECTYCHKMNHTAEQCYKKKRDEVPLHTAQTCSKCKRKGHLRAQCQAISHHERANVKSKVNHVKQAPINRPEQPALIANSQQPAPVTPAAVSSSAHVQSVNDGGQAAIAAKLRTDLGDMLVRLQQQQQQNHIQANTQFYNHHVQTRQALPSNYKPTVSVPLEPDKFKAVTTTSSVMDQARLRKNRAIAPKKSNGAGKGKLLEYLTGYPLTLKPKVPKAHG